MFSAVDDIVEAAVNNVLNITQRRIKDNLRLFNSHQNQHGGSLGVLEVIELSRVIAEIIATLYNTCRRKGET